jgi:hypothetical protein
MLTWSPQEPPGDLADIVGRWETFDTARAIAAILAFACQVGATAAARVHAEDREPRAEEAATAAPEAAAN